jgi:hypothetical protein
MDCNDVAKKNAGNRNERIGSILKSIKKLKSPGEEQERSLDLLSQLSNLICQKSDINKDAICTLREMKRQCSTDDNLVNCIGNLLKKMKQLYRGTHIVANLKDTTIIHTDCLKKSQNGIDDRDNIPTHQHELLPEGRQKIVTALQECFEENITAAEKEDKDNTRREEKMNRAARLSRDIEREIDRHHPYASSHGREYQAKTRQIYSDLKSDKVDIYIILL